MCTSMRLEKGGCCFGRNLDLEYEFGERIVITPRNYCFSFRRLPKRNARYAMIGMAAVADSYPLYAEAMNEKGLYIAGLNFPGNAYYEETEAEGCDNLSPFELIPWILSQCTSVPEAKALLSRLRLIHLDFRPDMPLTPLHWHIADETCSIVLEAMKDGIHIYDNPADVLTNNPPFDFHLTNLRQYMGLSAAQPALRFVPNETESKLSLSPFGQGMGAIGLPGDSSPASRFVKAAFLRANSAPLPAEASSKAQEEHAVGQFFHILNAVSMVRGSVLTPENKYDITTYSCCIMKESRTYYYTTYENQQISAVSMDLEDLNGDRLLEYPLRKKPCIAYQQED